MYKSNHLIAAPLHLKLASLQQSVPYWRRLSLIVNLRCTGNLPLNFNVIMACTPAHLVVPSPKLRNYTLMSPEAHSYVNIYCTFVVDTIILTRCIGQNASDRRYQFRFEHSFCNQAHKWSKIIIWIFPMKAVQFDRALGYTFWTLKLSVKISNLPNQTHRATHKCTRLPCYCTRWLSQLFILQSFSFLG